MKREFLVLFLIIFASQVSAMNFSENFQSYLEGYNTLAPIWIPQYNERVNISSSDSIKFLVIDSFTPFEDDRDIHAALNKTLDLNNATSIYINWTYKVFSCNSSWHYVKGISPEGSDLYLYYADPENFFSIEFKIYANDTDCGSGLSQILVFTRNNSISTNLTPYTPFYFNMSHVYVPEIQLTKLNLTHFILNLSLDKIQHYYGVIPIIVNSGDLLLESAGTITNFYDFYISSENNSTSIIQETPPSPVNTNPGSSNPGSSGSGSSISSPPTKINKNATNLNNNVSSNSHNNSESLLDELSSSLSSSSENLSSSQSTLSITGAVTGILTNKYVLPLYIIALVILWGWLISKVMEKRSFKI